MTVVLPCLEIWTRAPNLLALRPPPPIATPALISSSLYLSMAASPSGDGSAPVSDCLVALTKIMKRMVRILSIRATNRPSPDRHASLLLRRLNRASLADHAGNLVELEE